MPLFWTFSLLRKNEFSGICIELNEQEYASIRLREKNYAELDVTYMTTGLTPKAGDTVLTSAGLAQHRTVEPGLEVFVMQRYIDMIDEALALLGSSARAEFRESTPPPTVPIVSGEYTFVDPEQAARV
jgi:hypothetical protein